MPPNGLRATTPVTALALLVTLAGCGALTSTHERPTDAATDAKRPGTHTVAAAPPPAALPAAGPPRGLPERLPGLGLGTRARIPRSAEQVLIVTGDGYDDSTATVVLHQRTPQGWRPGTTWAAHNARDGWTTDHRIDDLRSPIGVFTLTDAGGRLRDPGARLPYHRSQDFTVEGLGFNGESLDGSFDYVVAINYNREPGTSPLDRARPLGADRGGGIWLHVDHDGPTHGCVALSERHMRQLLLLLDPARHPVVVMGDKASLAR
ncbi:L,D-transpeptidase family protein [Streptomyces sp. NPDC058045]|uniref:L,D-transpeptidase family protein n=1 Tax=Streptomyces sp. NPDC058045 TaxID=3346311 RepID=UPI0036EA7038